MLFVSRRLTTRSSLQCDIDVCDIFCLKGALWRTLVCFMVGTRHAVSARHSLQHVFKGQKPKRAERKFNSSPVLGEVPQAEGYMMAHLQKLGEIQEYLSIVLYSTAVFNLNCSFAFSSSRSFMFFWRPKERKAPANGKSSPPFLCSGVAGRHPSVKKVLPLEPFC